MQGMIMAGSFVSFAFQENVLENVTQSEDTLQFEVLIHHDQAVHAGLANRVEDGVQTIV